MDTPKLDDESIQGTERIAPDGTASDVARTSHLAIAACVLAVASLLLLPGLLRVLYDRRMPLSTREAYQVVTYGTSFLAVVFGLIGLARIALSAGRLTGRGYAWAGVAVPVTQGLLLFLLLPLMARTRCYAFTDTCGTHVAGIGKAMLVYANDYEDELPRAGGPSTKWDAMPADGWYAPSRALAYGMGTDGSGGTASITSCFYLLVKYAEVTPKSFICKGDAGATEFKLSNHSRAVPRGYELINLWDFGPPTEAYKHCSYSYHIPFGQYSLKTSDDPGFAVAADRSPWIAGPLTKASAIVAQWSRFKPDMAGPGVSEAGTSEQARRGNSIAHKFDGQNVLFLDSHVEFAKRAFCGLDDDNIYTISALPDRGDPWGTMPVAGPSCQPRNRRDSVLVNDPPPAEGR